MQPKLLIFFFTIFSWHTIATTNITWTFSRLSFQGERTEVLKLTDQTSEIFNQTTSGEKLIHALKEKKPLFNLVPFDGIYVYENSNGRKLHGNNIDIRGLYQILLQVFKEEFGKIPSEVNFKNFEKELEEYELVETKLASYPFITIRSNKNEHAKMIETIKKILSIEMGKKLFDDMAFCQKELLIYDDKHSVGGGGYTGATRPGNRIFNGEGSSAYIRFRFDQPDTGSHLVGTVANTTIPFTYIDNLYHELVHAKHLMCGTMSEFASEAQAIAEENQFRSAREETKDWPARDPRQYEEGKQVWFGHFIKHMSFKKSPTF